MFIKSYDLLKLKTNLIYKSVTVIKFDLTDTSYFELHMVLYTEEIDFPFTAFKDFYTYPSL